jgi:hypothetical protein
MVRQVPVRYGSIPRKKGRSRWLGVPLERPLGARQDGEHFDVEGVVFGRCATLCLYGEMGRQSVPQMEAVLDELLSLHPLSLTVDLSRASGVSHQALGSIARHEQDVGSLVVLGRACAPHRRRGWPRHIGLPRAHPLRKAS